MTEQTTLARIRSAGPCEDGWRKLLAHLGKTAADDEPLLLLTVLDSNGLDDALWVLSYAMPDDRLARHFQAWCAEQVLHLYESEYPGDNRVRAQIAMLRDDEASDAARAAARDAAGDAAGAAARAAAGAAAWAAAGAAARAAAWAAAGAAAWAAARDAAGDAAWAAAWAAQERQLRKMLDPIERGGAVMTDRPIRSDYDIHGALDDDPAVTGPAPPLPGMTLRDWFAGQALAGIWANGVANGLKATPELVALICYEAADAMIASRAHPLPRPCAGGLFRRMTNAATTQLWNADSTQSASVLSLLSRY